MNYSLTSAGEPAKSGANIAFAIFNHRGERVYKIARFVAAEAVIPKKAELSEAEAEMLGNAQYNESRACCRRLISMAADIYVKDKQTMKVGEMELTFLHTPGHTPGGMSIYVDKHIFSGDTLFCRSIGRSDFWGGDQRTLLNSIKDKLYLFPDDTIVLPGHMGPTTIGDEKRGNPFV